MSVVLRPTVPINFIKKPLAKIFGQNISNCKLYLQKEEIVDPSIALAELCTMNADHVRVIANILQLENVVDIVDIMTISDEEFGDKRAGAFVAAETREVQQAEAAAGSNILQANQIQTDDTNAARKPVLNGNTNAEREEITRKQIGKIELW